MKNLIALLIIIAGAVLGIYVGVWVMFVGGIVGLIEAFKASDISSFGVAINICKIVFAGFVGGVIFYIGAGLAGLIVGVEKYGKLRRKRK